MNTCIGFYSKLSKNRKTTFSKCIVEITSQQVQDILYIHMYMFILIYF